MWNRVYYLPSTIYSFLSQAKLRPGFEQKTAIEPVQLICKGLLSTVSVKRRRTGRALPA